jgi:hypothetical protein
MKNLLVILALVFSITACKKDSDKIIGNWTVNSYSWSGSNTIDGNTFVSFSKSQVTTTKNSISITQNYETIGNKIYLPDTDKDRNYGIPFSIKKNSLTINTTIGDRLSNDPAFFNNVISYLTR